MQKNHLKAAVIGGIVVFIWGMLSWMVFPWHQNCFKKFSNESEVARAVSHNAPTCGMYILPNTFKYDSNTSQSEMNKGMAMMEKGPFMFACVQPNGMGKMSIKPFIISLIIQIIGAFIATWMLLQTKGLAFRQKVFFITLFGLGAGVICLLPCWNWWGFPGSYVLMNIVDLVIAWFLAGLAIAKVLKK